MHIVCGMLHYMYMLHASTNTHILTHTNVTGERGYKGACEKNEQQCPKCSPPAAGAQARLDHKVTQGLPVPCRASERRRGGGGGGKRGYLPRVPRYVY